MKNISVRGIAGKFKSEISFYRKLASDKRCPKVTKCFIGMAVAYALSPVDLIPDFIPVIGHMDDAVIVPLLLYIGLRFVPNELVEELRKEGQNIC